VCLPPQLLVRASGRLVGQPEVIELFRRKAIHSTRFARPCRSAQAAGEVKIRRANLVYKTPWGAFMEILRRPDHLPYEKLTENRLFNPRDNRTSL
jgi:hypothetical protein